jgi:hypothetical protein
MVEYPGKGKHSTKRLKKSGADDLPHEAAGCALRSGEQRRREESSPLLDDVQDVAVQVLGNDEQTIVV